MPAVCVSIFVGQYFLKGFADIFWYRKEHASTGLWFKKNMSEWRNELKLIYIYMKSCSWHILLTFLPLRAYPSEQLVKKEGGILSFNDMFQTRWYLLCSIAQIASADTGIFQWAATPPPPPQSFCHVSPQIKAAVHSRSNCVSMVEKDSAGVMCYQVRPSVQLWSPSHIKYSQWASFIENKS